MTLYQRLKREPEPHEIAELIDCEEFTEEVVAGIICQSLIFERTRKSLVVQAEMNGGSIDDFKVLIRDGREILSELIGALVGDGRRILELKLGGLSDEEIAWETGKKTKAAHRALYRAKSMVRGEFKSRMNAAGHHPGQVTFLFKCFFKEAENTGFEEVFRTALGLEETDEAAFAKMLISSHQHLHPKTAARLFRFVRGTGPLGAPNFEEKL